MSPIEYVRKRVLALTQVEFAGIAGVSQGTVSRWEKSELEPSREEMSRIRAAAIDGGKAMGRSLVL